MDTADIDRLANDLKEAAAECGALLLEAVLPVEGRGGFIASVSFGEFLNLIRHAKPKIVYLITTSFDAAEELGDNFEEDDISDLPEAKKIIAIWRSHDGQACRVAAGLMCDGILHRAIEQTDWLEEFEGEIEQLVTELLQQQEISERELQAAKEKTIILKAKQLMGDSRFNGPKVGTGKRTALAQHLFPDLDQPTIRAIVDRAINDHWLATAPK
ncbi:hypothetical protein [Rhizobium jaguaris]|uniref:Uncharacterized protein n=1 Tax=Rhizobium jaguaris TaxID=1312183 RepID=A0A387FKJ8_9HYPH|nr:hypothetical protein [Rhizobium jaguaris]AYG59930.1 hypothetical protein CCGE525_14775 [Rhizobium jaguaris]